MRFRSLMIMVISVVLFYASYSFAQKRILDIVDPNVDAFNDVVEVYNPQTGTVANVGNLSTGRESATVLRMTSGKVLIAGGVNNRYQLAAEVYDPNDLDGGPYGSISATGDMREARNGSASLVVPGGAPIIIGGYNGNYLRSVEQYDPVSEKFVSISGLMLSSRQHGTATLLNDGVVLITGGFNGSFLSVAELYNPVTRNFMTTVGAMAQPRVGHKAVRISETAVFIAGGCNNSVAGEAICDVHLGSAEVYDDYSGTFTLVSEEMAEARKDHTVTLLNDGRVLIVGGMNDSGALNTAEIYDPATGTFALGGVMATARVNHTATILLDGRVIIAGGEDAEGNILDSIEIYDPATGFSSAGSTMSAPRTLHSATLLEDGRVLFAAGRRAPKMVFDINYQVLGDNIAGNIYITPDSKTGFVAYTGSGTIVAFSPETGEIISRIETGGYPIHITPVLEAQMPEYPDMRSHRYLAVVSALDSRIFVIDIIDPQNPRLHTSYSFANAGFGFGSTIALSPDGFTGYISSPEEGDVIKFDVNCLIDENCNRVETGRISGFRIPAQITVTGNGDTMLVVDVGANTVKGVSTNDMRVKYTFAPQDRYFAAAFSIQNKVALNRPDDTGVETLAIIGSQDALLDSRSTALLFDPRTGEWVLYEDEDGVERGGIYIIGAEPGWTMLLPNGESWLMLCRNYVSLIPTIDPRIEKEEEEEEEEEEIVATNHAISGIPMGSANVVLTSDGRYIFFASATIDRILQMDLTTGGIIGSYRVGDDPDRYPDQPIAVALSPDSSRLVTMNFITNELNLFVDSYIYRQIRYVSQQDRFTGISIVNVSPSNTVTFQVSAMANDGTVHYIGEDRPAPAGQCEREGAGDYGVVRCSLEPNEQLSMDVSDLLGLDNDVSNYGYLLIDSDQPLIVGYAAVGQIQSSFLTTYTRSMENATFSTLDDVSGDVILPEIHELNGATTEINVANPWYSTTTYTVTHYGSDGTEQAIQGRTLTSAARESTSASGVTTTVDRAQVVIVGGYSEYRTEPTADIFDGSSMSYLTPAATRAARHGHSTVSLANGKVLVAGGKNGFVIQKTAEVLDPSYLDFTYTPGSMSVERYRHTATRLNNGKTLLTGGQTMNSITRTSELFDFTAGSFRYTAGEMTIPRDAHTATLLTVGPDAGKVLITGGLDGVGITKIAELYDPESETFSPIPDRMKYARVFHTATLLRDGRVLLVGGYNGEHLRSTEVYNPYTRTFEETCSMDEPRSNHATTLLTDGTVLVTGGRNAATEEEGGLDTAEVYDPLTDDFFGTENTMTSPRSYHTAVNLRDDEVESNDRVIISGGFGTQGTGEYTELATLITSDLYTPATRMFTRTGSTLYMPRQGHTAILLRQEGTTGYLRLTSDTGILASESYTLETGGAPTSISAINMTKFKDIQTVYSPRFVLNGGERTTILNIINGNEEEAEITVSLRRANNGQEIVSRIYTVAANAQVNGNLEDVIFKDFDFDGAGVSGGWIEVSSTKDQVVGVVTFTSSDKKYLGSFELTGTPLEWFIFPLVTENADFETEISLLNPSATDAVLKLELWNKNGVIEKEKDVILVAGTNLYGKISDPDFFGMTTDTGNIRVKVVSGSSIYGIAEIGARSGRFITTVPAVDISKMAADD